MPLPLAAQQKLASARDTWQRLKPWVRWSASGLAILVVGGAAIWVLAPSAPPEQPVTSVPVSVRLSGIPADRAAMPEAPAETAPAVDNTEALKQLLHAKVTLKPAPFPELLVANQDGMLPRIGDDGTQPWRAYARPAGDIPAGAAKLAIVVAEAGLSEQRTHDALAQLPGQVSLAFDSYAPNLPDQINAARAAGHEALLDVPMEPETYPIEDPGPETLLTQISDRENQHQLRLFMGRAPGAFAIATTSGRQFVTESAALSPLLQDLKKRGMGWVDLTLKDNSTTNALAQRQQLPVASATIMLDDVLTPDRIKAQLASAVALAKKNGSAVIVARMYPLSLSSIAAFAETLPQQNVALVPVSAVMAVPSITAATQAPETAPAEGAVGSHK